MSLTAYPQSPREDGSSMIIFAGPPNVAVGWELTGPGSLTPQSPRTDSRGVAGCLFVPATAGDVVTVTVTHGT